MKKILALLMALMFIVAAAACTAPQPVIEEPVEEPAVLEEPVAEAPVEEPAAEPEVPQINLTILYEQDDSMINNYSLLAVDPEAPFADADNNPVSDVYINTVGAKALIDWFLSPEAKDLAANYGFEEYGEYLFYIKADGPASAAEIPAATEETATVRLSTTTSVNDSGLLGYMLPFFEEAYGYTVEVASAPTREDGRRRRAATRSLRR